MLVRSLLIAVALGGVAIAAQPQHVSPYAGQEHRAVASLSESEMNDLRTGAGMGMALPAELNGYPGPKHVLDLADRLALTTAQRATAERLAMEMRSRAVPLGEQVIAAEAELSHLFASGKATSAAVAAATARIEKVRGELRAAHLVTHLAMRDALTEDQRKAYGQLRGYAAGHSAH